MTTSREWLVRGDSAFWVQDDVRIMTLGELAVALAFMPAETYARYVDADKNNFADWVAGTFNELELAQAMRENPDQESVCRMLIQSLT